MRVRDILTRPGASHKPLARLLLIMGLMLCAGLQTRAETVTGKFRYLDSDGTLRPIATAKVEIWRFRPRYFTFFGAVWGWGNDATVTTDINGNLSTSMPFVTSGVVYGVRVFATNAGAVVYPNNVANTVPFYQEPGQPTGAIINRTASGPLDVLDFSFDFTDSWTPQHYNLAETVRRGFDFVNARRDPSETDPLPPVSVQPTSASISPTGTFYNYVADTLVIDSSEVFNDFIILHEYAHFVEEQISSFAPIAAFHTGCTALQYAPMPGLPPPPIINSPEHAWMEGFADYFAMAVAAQTPAGTLTATTGRNGLGTSFLTTLENPPACSASAADAVENMVAASLWDLSDQPGDTSGIPGDPTIGNEGHDFMSRMDTQIIQIMDREMDTYGHWPTITDFRNAWMARGLNSAGLDSILRQHGILPMSSPIGWLDSVDANGTAQGWSLDPDNGSLSIDVHFYVDAPWPAGTWAGQTTANLSRPDVNQVTGYPGDHGFSFTLPAQFRDGLPHTLYVYGIDATGDPNVLLAGVPMNFTLSTGRTLALSVVSNAKTTTTETITVYATDAATGAGVSGTVTATDADGNLIQAMTGQQMTYTHSVYDCNYSRKPPCVLQKQMVTFTVDVPTYDQASFDR